MVIIFSITGSAHSTKRNGRNARTHSARLKDLFRAAPSNAESFLRLVHDMHQAQKAFVYTRE